MSRQYEVPLNHVFPAIPSKTYHDWDEHEQYSGDDSSSEDNPIDGANSNDVQSDSESDTADSNSTMSRPQRNRKSPSWMRSGDYRVEGEKHTRTGKQD